VADPGPTGVRAADPPAANASLGDRQMKRALIGALAAATAAGLSACQTQPLEWYKEGVTPSEYAADVTYCDGARQQVQAYTPDDEMHWVWMYEIEAYNDCMMSRGYRLVEPGYEPRAQSAQPTSDSRR
jgi:hypothetical protein